MFDFGGFPYSWPLDTSLKLWQLCTHFAATVVLVAIKFLFQVPVLSLDLQDLELFENGKKERIKRHFQLMMHAIPFLLVVVLMIHQTHPQIKQISQLMHINIALLDRYQCKRDVTTHSICIPKKLTPAVRAHHRQIMELVTPQTNLAIEV